MSELLTSEDLKLLADIGFIATSRGFWEHAIAIFDVIRTYRPDGEAGFLGHGMIDILKGDPAAALKTLEAAPPTDGVKTFLGIAYIQVGDEQQGRNVLEKVCQTAADTPFAEIAKQTLETLKSAA